MYPLFSKKKKREYNNTSKSYNNQQVCVYMCFDRVEKDETEIVILLTNQSNKRS